MDFHHLTDMSRSSVPVLAFSFGNIGFDFVAVANDETDRPDNAFGGASPTRAAAIADRLREMPTDEVEATVRARIRREVGDFADVVHGDLNDYRVDS